MKKIFAIFVILAVIFSGTAVFADETCNVAVNGVAVKFDQPPIVVEGRTLVPIRAVAEQLGASVSWNQSDKIVTVKYRDTGVALQVGNINMTVRNLVTGEQYTEVLDVPATEYGGRTLSPIRAIFEKFGCGVGWDTASSTVVISTDDYYDIQNTRAIIIGE